MLFKDKLLNRFSKVSITNYFLTFFSILALSSTFYTVTAINNSTESHFSIIMQLLLELLMLLVIAVLITRRLLFYFYKDYEKSRIRARIILIFSIITAVPIIIVSIFSAILLNYAINNWFDPKISGAINQSVNVAEAYIIEHRRQLKETAFSLAGDLNSLYFQVKQNPIVLNEFLNAQADLRSLTEAMIFQNSNNIVVAQTFMSFALSFWKISKQDIEKANSGEVVEVLSEPGKIRMLIKLTSYKDCYLLVGRLIDEQIIKYVDKTKGAASQYNSIMHNLNSLQLSFVLKFIFIAALMIIIAIIAGTVFANKITRPIIKLVNATQLVQSGDFSVKIDVGNSKEDELSTLTNAFNKMVKKIDVLQKDHALAQRAIAWSDVARRVAHEIKNPLTPIILAADRLSKKFNSKVDDQEAFKRYTSTILRHASDIERIVSEFSNYARMPTPKFEIIDIIKLFKELLASRQVLNESITYLFHSNVEILEFKCDLTQMNQVIINLFKNSEEALENLNIEKKIILEVFENSEEIEISVSDNGRGFAPELIDKATEAYITTRSKGTGLGLAIVKKIAHDHHGDVVVENCSKNGGGKVRLVFDKSEIYQKNA